MPLRVFFATQNHRDDAFCATLIREAMEQAAREIGQSLEIEAVDRPPPGRINQPPAIRGGLGPVVLDRIREADVFLADLTLTGPGAAATTPCPNVMLEYGYALAALGEQRTLAVMNEAFGAPATLPADLQLKNWPILYSAAAQADPEAGERARQQARVLLTGRLKMALKALVTQFPDGSAGGARPHLPAEPMDGVGRFLAPGETLCVRTTLLPATITRPVRLAEGPYLFLRLFPHFRRPPLTNAEAQRITHARLHPMSAPPANGIPTPGQGGIALGRNAHGAVAFSPAPAQPDLAESAVQLFLSGEIWGIDLRLLERERLTRASGINTPFIPTGAVEEALVDGLVGFAEAGRGRLQLAPPIRIEAGLSGIADYTLAIRKERFAEPFAGHVFPDHVVHAATLEGWDFDPYMVLKPLFDAIYDAAGLERPDYRVSGRRRT
ncbi:MAG: hypothetical protein JO264_09685 [Acidisphaera sp.]|nr:hypothetical protein [Acidisphaera sp.]